MITLEEKREMLHWNPTYGLGYINLHFSEQKVDYFDEYIEMERESAITKALNKFRVVLVRTLTQEQVLDIGIGCGTFISSCGNAKGFDVDKKSIEWLEVRSLWLDPFLGNLNETEALTFWDSFEHITDPWEIIRKFHGKYVFISIPIFEDKEDAVSSIHFKPLEHRWYFTEWGLIKQFKLRGFKLLKKSNYESEIGRQGIEIFVFKQELNK